MRQIISYRLRLDTAALFAHPPLSKLHQLLAIQR